MCILICLYMNSKIKKNLYYLGTKNCYLQLIQKKKLLNKIFEFWHTEKISFA